MKRVCLVDPLCHPSLPWQHPIFSHSSSSSFCPRSPSCCSPYCPPSPLLFPSHSRLIPQLGRRTLVVRVSHGQSGSRLARIMRKRMGKRALSTWMWWPTGYSTSFTLSPIGLTVIFISSFLTKTPHAFYLEGEPLGKLICNIFSIILSVLTKHYKHRTGTFFSVTVASRIRISKAF